MREVGVEFGGGGCVVVGQGVESLAIIIGVGGILWSGVCVSLRWVCRTCGGLVGDILMEASGPSLLTVH